MKKFAKFTALAVGLVAMLFAGCSDFSDDAVVTKNATSSDNYRTLTIDVTSNSNLLNFGEATSNGSRTILPDAEVCNDLFFYLCSKNNTAGETAWSTPVNVTVTPKTSDTTGRTGEVIINLTKADYDFELFAVQKKGATTPPSYANETNLKSAAVLVAYANADIRNDDTVSFYMTAEGLTTKGDVALYLYTDGWKLSDFPDFVNSSTPVSPNAKLTYTKKTGTNAEGATYSGSESGAGFGLFDAAPTPAPDYTDAKVYKANVDPGTYNFELSFTNGTKTYTWSDRIIVLPGKVTQKVIGIPLVIEKVPLAPNYLNVAYIDPESTTTEYYNAEFVWDSKGNDGTANVEINNEEKFELQLLSVPSTVADTEITTYESALSAATTDEARATAWTSLSATAMGASAGGTTVVWSTVDGSTNTASTGSAVNVNTRVFYGNLDTWVSGSLQKNNQYAIFKLPLGSRYVARIRAVNAAGASSWVYADLSKDIKGETSNAAVTLATTALDASSIVGTKDALHFTSKTINRYRVTYDLSGGTLTQGTITSTVVTSGTANTDTTNLATVYYYCQKFNTVTTTGSGTTATTTYADGVEIMRPTGADPDTSSGAAADATVDNNFTTLEANGANPVLVAQNPLLKLNAQTWTNWLCDLTCTGAANTKGEYNEVGKVPDTYGGCKSLTLVANYATVGTVTIFDDEKYAIADVTSDSSGTSGTAAITSDGTAASGSTAAVKAVVYKIEASQKKDVTLTWTVTYPTGVTYDNVTLKLTSTDGQRSYNIGNISATKTFTLKVSEYVKGVYNAKISAWSSVKPNDPYTANIVLTIVD